MFVGRILQLYKQMLNSLTAVANKIVNRNLHCCPTYRKADGAWQTSMC